MRVIKFRAWDSFHNRMEYGSEKPYMYLTHAERRIGIGFNLDSDFYHRNNECIFEEHVFLEQYTGLKDKNGKETYDNDVGKRIVERDNFNPGGGMGQPRYDQPATRSWKEEQIRVITISDNGTPRFGHSAISHMDMKEIEVIGNIHENPELLKE